MQINKRIFGEAYHSRSLPTREWLMIMLAP